MIGNAKSPFWGRLRTYEMWKNSPYPGMAKRYAETLPTSDQSIFKAWDREVEQDGVDGLDRLEWEIAKLSYDYGKPTNPATTPFL